ncbi:MAG: hypothetical protein JXB04_04630 [Kiritimatiellae bacterium]|nr:hypothetical protein [Kiritimatiellia bacterium]
MATPIRITVENGPTLDAELNDSASAREIIASLPLEFEMHRWGEEYYGDCGLESGRAKDARDVMEIGELAVWPAGHALCIFFGPTPSSKADEPRAYEPVNPVGRVLSDVMKLKDLGETIKVKVEKA